MKKIYTKNKKIPTSFSLSPQAIKALKKISKNAGISRSAMISDLILHALTLRHIEINNNAPK